MSIDESFWINFWNKKEFKLADNTMIKVAASNEPHGPESFQVLEAAPARLAAEELLDTCKMMLERLEDCGDKWESPEEHELEMEIYRKVILKAVGT